MAVKSPKQRDILSLGIYVERDGAPVPHAEVELAFYIEGREDPAEVTHHTDAEGHVLAVVRPITGKRLPNRVLIRVCVDSTTTH
jgi:hypothetical protein